MEKEAISVRQSIAIILLFITGEFSILASGLSAKKDVWISILLATVVSFVLMFIYVRILKFKQGESLLDIITDIFGRYIGKIIIAFYAYYCFDLAGLVLRDYVQFVKITSFDRTPFSIPGIFILFLSVFVLKKGLHILCKWSELFVYFPYVYVSLTVFTLFPMLDVDNLKPVMFNGIGPIIHGSFELLMFPFGEIVVFLILLFPHFNIKDIKKIGYTSLTLSSAYLFIVSIFIIMIIGENYAVSLVYTAHGTAKLITIGKYLQRSEILASINFTIGVFAKVSIYLLAACLCIKKLLNLDDHKIILIPIALLALNYTLFSFDSILEYDEYIFEIWIYFAFIFIAILPIFILITANIKKLFVKN